jgi:hypothetical protein
MQRLRSARFSARLTEGGVGLAALPQKIGFSSTRRQWGGNAKQLRRALMLFTVLVLLNVSGASADPIAINSDQQVPGIQSSFLYQSSGVLLFSLESSGTQTSSVAGEFGIGPAAHAPSAKRGLRRSSDIDDIVPRSQRHRASFQACLRTRLGREPTCCPSL